MADLNKLRAKFFTDPDWAGVEELLGDYIKPMLEMDTVDLTQPAENVKAEVIGRMKAYEAIKKFLDETGMSQKGRQSQDKNIFR